MIWRLKKCSFKNVLSYPRGIYRQSFVVITSIFEIWKENYGFLLGGKKPSGFQPGCEMNKKCIKKAKTSEKRAKSASKWHQSTIYHVILAKNCSRYLGSNFCTKFQISQPGWHPDRAIKIPQIEKKLRNGGFKPPSLMHVYRFPTIVFEKKIADLDRPWL